jgi:hypothetical protein
MRIAAALLDGAAWLAVTVNSIAAQSWQTLFARR